MAKTKGADAPNLDHIEPALRPLAVPIEQLKPNPRQANAHDERSLAVIARSLAAHGQKKNAVANSKGEMIAGWGTVLAAAQRLDWTHLAVVFSDENERGLDEYALEDNRTAQLSEFDEVALAKELERLADIGTDIAEIGWTAEEMAALETMSNPTDPEPPPDFPEVDEDIDTEHTCPKCGYRFSGGK